jgi:hypothetical protein
LQAATVVIATATAAPSPPPTAAATIVAPTATPAPQFYSVIAGVALQGSTYVVDFVVQGYALTGSIADRHVHFFFNSVTPQQAGVPGTGPWFAYAGGSPFTGYATSQAGGATQMCILVANPDHSVIQGTGNCVNLP